MSHIHWVPRQNKLEISRDKDEVNKRLKVQVLARDPTTIVSRHEQDVVQIYYESMNRELNKEIVYY
jgi:hypothetical protein